MKQLLFIALTYCVFTSCHSKYEGWKTIDEDSYSIKYPADWTSDETGWLGTEFILSSTLESDSDTYKENVNLVTQDLSQQKLDLDKYTEISKGQVGTMLQHSKFITIEKLHNQWG